MKNNRDITIKTRVSLNPQTIDQDNWFYIDKKGIDVVHQIYGDDSLLRIDIIRIPFTLMKNIK